jgi:hypothetical protein
MRVERWVSYPEAEVMSAGLGGMGGFFGWEREMRWQDYLDAFSFTDKQLERLEALRAEIVRRGLKEGGDWHQYSDCGVPVFSDGTVGDYSFRAWGDLLAAIWSEEEDKHYTYMDFYMTGDRE